MTLADDVAARREWVQRKTDMLARESRILDAADQVQALTERVAALEAENALLEQDNANLTADLVQARQTIADLEERIRELEEGGQTTTTLWGASVVPKTGETLAAALAREDAALGLDVVRVYDGAKGLAAAWKTAQTLGAPGWPSVIGFRCPPATILTGAKDAEMTAVFRDLPAGCWWTYEAECDRHVLDGEYTGDDFQAAWVHVANLAASVGCLAKSTLMLTGYLFEQRIDAVWPGDRFVDCLAIDPYGHPGDTYQSRLGVAADYAAAHGCTWGVGETGWDPAQGGQAGVQSWVTLLAEANGRADFVCWWENGTGPDYRISDKPDTAAVFKAIPRG